MIRLIEHSIDPFGRTVFERPPDRLWAFYWHYARQAWPAFLAVMVLGCFGGMAVTYVNNGKLFVGPHLLVGIVMTSLIALAVSMTQAMQQGNLIARKVHVGLNMGVMTLFLWQAFTGIEIVNKIWTSR